MWHHWCFPDGFKSPSPCNLRIMGLYSKPCIDVASFVLCLSSVVLWVMLKWVCFCRFPAFWIPSSSHCDVHWKWKYIRAAPHIFLRFLFWAQPPVDSDGVELSFNQTSVHLKIFRRLFDVSTHLQLANVLLGLSAALIRCTRRSLDIEMMWQAQSLSGHGSIQSS